MNATQVVIHFIGLVLFSTHVTNDPGLHAILPAIRQDLMNPVHLDPIPTKSAQAGAPSSSPAAAPASAHAHIEPHVALLVFPANIVANDSQWSTSTVVSRFPGATELAAFKYVELTGEHITFLVDAPNDFPAVLPANMPRVSCGKTSGLRSGFEFPYSQAAAVVDIAEGQLSVCNAKPNAPGRIDTRLVLNTTGTLTIVAVRSGVVKTLLLNTTSNPTIYLANVPPPGNTGIAAASDLTKHFRAYYGMIGRNPTSPCSGPSVTGGTTVPDCDMETILPIVPPGATHEPPPGSIPSVNAECSNTQWP